MRIQISSGKGPIECEYAVGLYAERLKDEYGLEIISQNESQKNCYSSIVLYSKEDIDIQTGTVQWICESSFRKHHKRKNWFIDVSILEEKQEMMKEQNIKYEMIHSSGKGGQNVNKVATAVRAIHVTTGTTVTCMDQRTQGQNKKIAYCKLMNKLQEQQSLINDNINYKNWNQHNLITRGNPIRVYKGLNFKRVK